LGDATDLVCAAAEESVVPAARDEWPEVQAISFRLDCISQCTYRRETSHAECEWRVLKQRERKCKEPVSEKLSTNAEFSSEKRAEEMRGWEKRGWDASRVRWSFKIVPARI